MGPAVAPLLLSSSSFVIAVFRSLAAAALKARVTTLSKDVVFYYCGCRCQEKKTFSSPRRLLAWDEKDGTFIIVKEDDDDYDLKAFL